MNYLFKHFCLASLLLFFISSISAQVDSTYEDEEDYSMYDDVEDVGEIITYCSPKIFDLSPNRFISIGYDITGTSSLKTSPEGFYKPDEEVTNLQSSNINYQGLRVNANIPVISLSKFVWQVGGGFNQANFSDNRSIDTGDHSAFLDEINEGLTSMNLNTTLFKPTGEKTFMILQLIGEINGNYTLGSSNNGPKLENTKLSGTFIYGKRPNDRLQWGVGVSRTYRAGELNYIPVIMYNYTSENRKWGTEILFPARAAYRRKINPRNVLLAGYELEGGSYRLYNTKFNAQNLELRRSEIRLRLDYQKQIKGFLWLGIQAGVILNYSYNVDDLTATDNKDFYRGFFGSQEHTFKNNASPMPYINLTLNLVSL